LDIELQCFATAKYNFSMALQSANRMAWNNLTQETCSAATNRPEITRGDSDLLIGCLKIDYAGTPVSYRNGFGIFIA